MSNIKVGDKVRVIKTNVEVVRVGEILTIVKIIEGHSFPHLRTTTLNGDSKWYVSISENDYNSTGILVEKVEEEIKVNIREEFEPKPRVVIDNEIGKVADITGLSFEEIQKTYSEAAKSTIAGLTGKGDISHKALFSSIDPRLLYEVGIGFRKGAIKHGLNNFRTMDLSAAQGVWDSLNRHVNDYARGITIDPETGVSNIALIVTNASMLSRLAYKYGHDKVIEAIYCGDIK